MRSRDSEDLEAVAANPLHAGRLSSCPDARLGLDGDGLHRVDEARPWEGIGGKIEPRDARVNAVGDLRACVGSGHLDEHPRVGVSRESVDQLTYGGNRRLIARDDEVRCGGVDGVTASGSGDCGGGASGRRGRSGVEYYSCK